MKNEAEVFILGAGLVGSLLSVNLAKKGFKVAVFEKRSDPRAAKKSEGRSINLALSHRGLKALEQVNLKEKVSKIALPMHGRLMHSQSCNLTKQPYGKAGQYINSISRSELNKMLIDEAENAGVHFYFDHQCTGITLESRVVDFVTNKGPIRIELQDCPMFGSDGAYSMLRQVLQKTDRFNFSQEYLDHGYKELTIPAKRAGFAIDPNSLHIWPRGGFMLIALPNQDKSFTCTLFLPWEGAVSFEHLNNKSRITSFFKEYFPDVVPLMPNLEEEFQSNPTSSLVSTSCFPWSKNKFILIGDAAHAIVPFYGQGMNAGFEDCRILMEIAEEKQYNWNTVFREFELLRKPDADAIKELALQNFIEMRDKVGQPKFLTQKRIESQLNEMYPEEWLPQYTMVTFSDIPYREALKDGNLKNEVVSEFLCRNHADHEISHKELEELLKTYQEKKESK